MRTILTVAGILAVIAVFVVFWLVWEAIAKMRAERKNKVVAQALKEAIELIGEMLDDITEALDLDAEGTPFLDRSVREQLEDLAGRLRQQYNKEQTE